MNTDAVELIQKVLDKAQKTRDKPLYLAQIDTLSQLAQGLAAFEETADAFWSASTFRETLEQGGAAQADIAVAVKAENKAVRQHTRNCEKLKLAIEAARALLKPKRKLTTEELPRLGRLKVAELQKRLESQQKTKAPA